MKTWAPPHRNHSAGARGTTSHRWKHIYPDFCEALKIGKGPTFIVLSELRAREARHVSLGWVKLRKRKGEPKSVALVLAAPVVTSRPPHLDSVAPGLVFS